MATASQIIIKEIQDLYLSDALPWIIGYSGGKDSTASLQLIWHAIAALPEERRRFKPVHVISTDTLVENPVIAAWVELSLTRMNVASMHQGLPIRSHRLTPELKNRFWVNLIGKGYPAPRPKFRWCTDRLKISASTKFIQELSEANGEAILVLGQRRGESSARDKVMDEYGGSTRDRLNRNKDPKLSRVWVYLPIETWTSDDVWEYLITNSNPWGTSNQDLFDIYRGATPDAECPIVVDKSTPSCGDSRFGCYVCTMVSQDKSMAAMIQNDAAKAWMQPIMSFRDRYLSVKDRDKRDFRRMNGRLTLDFGELIHGPYTQQYRELLLRELLRTQKQVQFAGKDEGVERVELLPLEEIEEIRRLWVEDKGEIEDAVPRIYAEVFGTNYPGRELDPMPLDPADLEMLRTVAAQWSKENQAALSDTAEEQRTVELYKMVRTLLATSFKGLQSRKRSKQLDDLEHLLKTFSFLDEADALAFAQKHMKSRTEGRKQITADGNDSGVDDNDIDEEVDELDELQDAELASRRSRVIPITIDTSSPN